MKRLFFILLLGLGFINASASIKIIDININNWDTYTMQDLFPDYDLEWARITILDCTENGSCEFNNGVDNMMFNPDINEFYYNSFGSRVNELTIFQNNTFYLGHNNLGADENVYFKLLVTAEFPEEDTGYIEEGFEFCLQPGANLVSYPCDNPVPVGQALPNGIENFVTAIIGQGVATEYNSALGWIGSLDSFNEGGGYWFKSNSAVCFQYDCVAN
tara:strand:- start:73 stop:720 length:648 start_codon:yes stop_codon:yes gene_type:complete